MDVTKSCRDINELDSDTQIVCKQFLEECKKKNLNVLITETYRSQQRQNYLYEQGRTRPGSVVTWTKNSKHTGRRAFDFCKNVKGHEYDDNNFFKQCAEIGRKLGLDCGYFWTGTQDKPHMELPKGVKPQTPQPTQPNKKLTKVKIDGKIYELEAHVINDYTFVKLRDFEKAGYKIGYVDGIATINKP